MPLDDAVARIDLGVLPDADVLRLRLSDAQLGLQVRRIRDPREVGARRDLGSAFHGNLLEHTRHAGLDLEIVEPSHLKLVGGTPLGHVGLLRRDLRLDPIGLHVEAFLTYGQPVLQLIGRRSRLLQLNLRNQLVFPQFLVRLERHRRVLV